MKLLKQLLFGPVLKFLIKKTLTTQPKVVNLEERQCIGYMITTTLKGNQKKKDIPPFYHEVYDNDKLSSLRQGNEKNMYCIFNMHENGQDFDYYVTVENKAGISGENYAEVTLPAGQYVQIAFMKRNHRAAALIVVYIKKVWIALNGYKARNSPLFILYDERFHRNHERYGCQGDNYLGDPIAVLHVPLK